MARFKDIRKPGSEQAKSSLWVDRDVAEIVRRIASTEGRHLTPVLREMVELYARERGWELVYDETPEPATTEPVIEPESVLKSSRSIAKRDRRSGKERRSVDKTPIPGSASPTLNRRKRVRRKSDKKRT